MRPYTYFPLDNFILHVCSRSYLLTMKNAIPNLLKTHDKIILWIWVRKRKPHTPTHYEEYSGYKKQTSRVWESEAQYT